MTPRRRILALSFFPAFVPPNNGGVERLFNFYAALSRHHDVTLLSSSFLNGEREVVRHRPSFIEIRVPKDGHFAAAYADLATASGEGDISGPALGKSLATMGALHDEYLANYAQSDVIIHDSPFLVECDLLRGFDSKPRIYNSYNCETDLYSSFHGSDGGPSIIADLVRDLEADLCQHSDLITVCADEDAQAFRRRFAPTASIIKVPNGFVPGPAPSSRGRDRHMLAFVGSAHKPNIDAVRTIIDDIAPRMRDVDFHLIGSCHAKGRTGNVTSHGVIPQHDKQRLLRRATAALNPMASGGGSSLKIADIASNGCPLISSELGARGFDLEPGLHYIYLDLTDPIETIRAALDDTDFLEQVAKAASSHIERRFSWIEIVESFVARLEQLFAIPTTALPTRLVINDYDSLASTGGGATRTRGLCKGMAESGRVIFLTFAGDNVPRRRLSADGRILSVLVDKLPSHLEEDVLQARAHWVSTADVVSYQHAPQNPRMMALFRCAASASSVVICEHPYMVGMPRAFEVDFVYSSQNFETKLKAEGLWSHPDKDRLLTLVHDAESFACAASSFIVAVSQADAADLGAAYRSTAPILVIPNGAEGPDADARGDEPLAVLNERPVAIFMGSGHGPNYEAANWIATKLAPSMPHCDFVIIGSVASSLAGPWGANVTLVGQVSSLARTNHLYAAQVALNPMMTGSGSNVKMADYLQHGLPVLTTEFGARGYEWVPDADARVASLEEFREELCALLSSPLVSAGAREARQATYATMLAMDAGGRRLAQLIDAHAGNRKRALYVTYRYNDPPRGGGEEYVDRLVHALAASGWEVDVVAPAADRIIDLDRFAAAFFGADAQPIPTGRERVRSTRFALDPTSAAEGALKRLWNAQSDFEEHVARAFRPPTKPCLAWGWADHEGFGRWCFRSAGLYVPDGGELKLKARAMTSLWLQIFSGDGRRLFEAEVANDVDVTVQVPRGFVSLAVSMQDVAGLADPRPLALFVTLLELDGRSLLEDRLGEGWTDCNSSAERMAALAGARVAIRERHALALTPLRSASHSLDHHVREHVSDYDLMVTHNAVFASTTAAIAAADAAGVPSILVPHLHYDDDFYHFPDILAACGTASRTLVCPHAVERQLAGEGLDNVTYLSPGVDVSMTFSDDDVVAFGAARGTMTDDFFLVLGRKTGAKGYRDIIATLAPSLADPGPMIVMIGADDDGVPIDHPRVSYLGRQPDAVVRGALRQCLGLINMSRSESFGMVLLQAGLAGKPVLANRACAAFADIVENEVNGYLVGLDDLSRRMATLRKNKALRRKLGNEGRKRALEYDWKNMERQFIRICESLVKR